MSHFPKVIKRILAMVLAMALLLSCGNFGLIAQVYAHDLGEDHDHTHTTLGQLIVKNYDELTENEKNIISSGMLKGDEGYEDFVYSAPPEIDDENNPLVEVDEENLSVIASAFEDEGDNIWVPVSFVLKDKDNNTLDIDGKDNGEDVIDLDETDGKYTGSYKVDGVLFAYKEYSVDVTYKLERNTQYPNTKV